MIFFIKYVSLLQLKAFYVDLLVPLETNLEKDTKVVQVSKIQLFIKIRFFILYITKCDVYKDSIR